MVNNQLPQTWKDKLNLLDIAFQPIINIHTGKIYAVEALLRNYRDIGFKSIFSIFDSVYKEGVLYYFDLALREKTLKKFTEIKNHNNIKLFYNLDNRLFDAPNYSTGNTNILLKQLGIKRENICFEISERHEIADSFRMESVLKHYKDEEFFIAIDDFGVGYSGYKLLFDSTPDIIKIDRYFLQDIEKNMKKKLMVKSITHLAIQLGIQVIAEGVETKAEYLTCRDIGCNLVQGYYVQRPTQETKEISSKYKHIVKLLEHCTQRDKISKTKAHVQKIKPLQENDSMHTVVNYFKKNKATPIIPIINNNDETIGILLESTIKEYLYSPYGISLLLKDTNEESKLKDLIKYCPAIDINSDISTIIELFSNNTNSNGILITKNSSYYGFLSSSSIINVMNEENLILARDQNPLTKLPGNRLVEKYISDATNNEKKYILCYFDLDNFKAFNDVYGFRNGDRVIQLFSEIITKHLPQSFFKGHIGGDDFFVAAEIINNMDKSIEYIQNIISIFENDAKEFYSQADKENGYIVTKSRDGINKKFPFLSVSASIVFVNADKKSKYTNLVNHIFSLQKKVAKSELKHLSASSLL